MRVSQGKRTLLGLLEQDCGLKRRNAENEKV